MKSRSKLKFCIIFIVTISCIMSGCKRNQQINSDSYAVASSELSSLFSIPSDKYNKTDYRNYQKIRDKLFQLYDKGYFKLNENVDIYESDPKDQKSENIKRIMSKYKNDIAQVYFVDKNVILLSFGGCFQSVFGIAVRRNNAELKDTYECTGFDEGSLEYKELFPNVYYFSAGL